MKTKAMPSSFREIHENCPPQPSRGPESEERTPMKFRLWLEGFGLSMLYLLPLIAIFLAPGQNGLYHQVLPITSLTRGVLLDLLFLALLLGAGRLALNHVEPSAIRRVLWLPVLFATAWATERGIAEFFRNVTVDFALPAWAPRAPWFVLGGALVLLLVARRYYDFAIKAAELYLASAGIATVFVVLPQLVFACFNHAPPDQASFVRPVRQAWHAGETRVIWLLFDELSYNQAFDHRQPGIDLPAFTRLRKESVSFSHLVPTGNLTQMVIPSLLSGHIITAITSNRQGELLWRSRPKMGWQRFDPETTVFGAARRNGWSTGVVGWYNPYCRILATTLDRCDWTFQEFAAGPRFSRLSSRKSTWENARDALPFVPQIENKLQHRSLNDDHKDDFRRVLDRAKLLVKDENIRFAFVHLPVPHPPGIFVDPLPVAGGKEDYLGNLILADRALAQLRQAVDETAAGAHSILVVSSDHSWRAPWYRNAPGWTPAEEHASNEGQFDDRPVLLIHFPDQTTEQAESVDQPRSAMILHSLLLDIVSGKILNLQQFKEAVDVPSGNGG